MEKKGRVLEGDEKNLVLIKILLEQEMKINDILLLVHLDNEKEFLEKYGLSDKLNDLEALNLQIDEALDFLSNKNKKKDETNKYINSHEINVKVFNDTMNWISENKKLSDAVAKTVSSQFVWKEGEDFPVETEEKNPSLETKVFTSSKRTFEAAEKYAKAGKRVAVLNFANNHHVGGGVITGANAQEECLCRCSTLYPCIKDSKMMMDFYNYHVRLFENRRMDFTGNDDLIYSPGVVVCKTDTPVPERMEEKDWYKVDVITAAAPNLRGLWFDTDKEYEIHLTRFTAILEAAKKMGAEVLILGAFGCGAFANRPEVVAHAAFDALKYYKGFFETVEFAVFSTMRDRHNYNEFVKVFGE